MRIAVAQILSSTDPSANLDLVADAVAWAGGAGADVLVLPEATMCRFGVPLAPVAEPLDGPWATAVRALAAEHDVLVIAGMFTPAGDRVANTLLMTGRSVDAHYDKIHLFDAFGFTESATVAPGTAPVVVDLDGVGVGVATCYDVRFPGLFTALAERGADVVCLPASWGAGPGKREQWEVLVRARALDATVFVVAAGQADPTAVGEPAATAPTGIGHSLVASPAGAVLGELGPEPGRLLLDLDPADVATTRAAIPVLANRRF